MTMRIHKQVALALCLGLGACGSNDANPVSAADITPTLITADAQNAAQSGTGKRQYLGLILSDSTLKCTKFSGTLVGTETEFNTTADILSAIASGLGALLSPLATTHAISTVGTVITGTKAAVNTNVWAKQPTTNLLAALSNTYWSDVKKYQINLDGSNEASLTVSNEVSKILSIHQECNLAEASTGIQQKVSQPPPADDTTQTPPTPLAGPGPRVPAIHGLVPGPTAGVLTRGSRPGAAW